MKSFLLRLLTVIGGLVVVALLVAVAIRVGVQVARSRVPGKTLLEANLQTGLIGLDIDRHRGSLAWCAG